MALSVVQKNANYRINHADFQDVGQITYALGTISDVQTLQADPIVPTSLVKVTGDWGESDFIPLFYTPKKSYWDICPDWLTLYKSQDLNPDALTSQNVADFYYKTAWTSFRPGDQVKVMLQAPAGGGDLVPVAVLGFGDGVPRLGENIIKFDIEGNKFYYTAFGAPGYTAYGGLPGPGMEYSGGPTEPGGTIPSGAGPGYSEVNSENGPDGLDLKLLQPYSPTVGAIQTQGPKTYWQTLGSFGIITFWFRDGVYVQTGGSLSGPGVTFQAWYVAAFGKYTVTYSKIPVSFGPIPVGPVDFVLNYQAEKTIITWDPNIYYYAYTSPMGGAGGVVLPSPPYNPIPVVLQPIGLAGSVYGGYGTYPVYDTDPLDWTIEGGGSFDFEGSVSPGPWPGGDSNSYDYSFPYAGTYPPGVPNQDFNIGLIIPYWAWPGNYPPNPDYFRTSLRQPDGIQASIHGQPPVTQTLLLPQAQGLVGFVGIGHWVNPTADTGTAYVRPHTKDELQAAGMWPPGLS